MYIINGELYHHGIKGMHWGIRRFQPYPDGSSKGKFIGKKSQKETTAREELINAGTSAVSALLASKASKIFATLSLNSREGSAFQISTGIAAIATNGVALGSTLKGAYHLIKAGKKVLENENKNQSTKENKQNHTQNKKQRLQNMKKEAEQIKEMGDKEAYDFAIMEINKLENEINRKK